MSARYEIEAALTRYAWGYDSNDMELLNEAFTEDAILTRGDGSVAAEGRDAIVAWMGQSRRERLEAKKQPRHIVSNVIVDRETDDEAEVRSYGLMVITEFDGTVTVDHIGPYHDRLVRDGTVWRLAKRRLGYDLEYVNPNWRDAYYDESGQPLVRGTD
jgi:hypothetical protein